MELKSIFDSWAKSVKPEYSHKQWLLSKWEMFENIEWPEEKSTVMLESIRQGLTLQPSDSLIELGCGGGWIIGHLIRYVKTVFGLDFSLEMLGHAETVLPSGRIVCGDIKQLPLRGEWFDKVLCYYVLLNFSDDQDIERSLSGIWRILKKNGKALIGQLPDESKSHLYDRAKQDYQLFHQKQTELGHNTSDDLPPPIKLFNRDRLEKFFKQNKMRYQFVDSFNPFYYEGQPKTIDWRFDIVLEK